MTARVVGQDSRDDEEAGENVLRRELLMLGGVTLAGGLVGSSADPVTGPIEAVLVAAPERIATPGVPVLRRVLDRAWRAYADCRYAEAARGLPRLINAASVGRDDGVGEERARYSALLAQAYILSCELAVKRNENSLAWVSGDRALQTARASGTPSVVAAASLAVGMSMRRVGRCDSATRLLAGTANDLVRHARPTPETLADYGSLLCAASYAAAQGGRDGVALDLLDEAERAAVRIGGTSARTAGHRSFTPTNVDVYRISVCTALGDTAAALDAADRVRPHRLASAERRQRFVIDKARALVRHGRTADAFVLLRTAEATAPEEYRRPSVRALVGNIIQAPGPKPHGLYEMAARIGAPR
ncbi:XRE family transcriptional regulator [Actinomadura harenae]|uniref:XRE family transcriptional regulator n=1 Tax=Actinomadura harenae TaxID=2483351 RepID=A0A3M2LS24_9ACTN|nr:XRE family transcriptional regulator [Actinomadura harenae]RMI39700.1 XRE family transcriptional regulator [Actinomadura harenae]